MQQYLVVVISLGSHYCGTNLAEAYTMSPSGTSQSEGLRHSVLDVVLVDNEGATVQMSIAQSAAYFQFLTDGERLLGANNLQSADASAASSFYGDKVDDAAKVNLQAFSHEVLQLLLRIGDVPTVEVGSLLVVIVEHLREYLSVVGVAQRFGCGTYPFFGVSLDGEVGQIGRGILFALDISHIPYSHEIRLLDILPAVLEFLGSAATAFGEAGVAYLVVVQEYLSACGVNGLRHLWTCSLCYALVALAMVVGANVEDGMVFAVVPLYEFVVLAYEREESVLSGTCLLFASLFHLCEQPAA